MACGPLRRHFSAMKKVMLAAVAAIVLLVLALGAMLFFGSGEWIPNATPCERDCINDSGGTTWCIDYCKHNETYGPQPKK